MENTQKLVQKHAAIKTYYDQMEELYKKHVHNDFKTVEKQIKENIYLDSFNRDYKLKELKQAYTVRAMAFMREFKGIYDMKCETLKQEARTELANLEPVPADEATRKIFEKDLKAIERKLLLAVDNRTRAKLLGDLMNITREPALAAQSLDVFMRYAAKDIADTTASNDMRASLVSKLKKLEELATPAGEGELRAIIDDCEQRQERSIAITRVMHGSLSSISQTARAFAGNPEKYFVRHVEDVEKITREHGSNATDVPVHEDYAQLETAFLQVDAAAE
ncbi:hypothetical protein IGI01_02395 [Bacillus thuringiensis]|nr:hypothetical protein [Bacillus thuringiensis]